MDEKKKEPIGFPPSTRYRLGYNTGKGDSFCGNPHSPAKGDDPFYENEHYLKGYDDGYNGRAYDAPSP